MCPRGDVAQDHQERDAPAIASQCCVAFEDRRAECGQLPSCVVVGFHYVVPAIAAPFRRYPDGRQYRCGELHLHSYRQFGQCGTIVDVQHDEPYSLV